MSTKSRHVTTCDGCGTDQVSTFGGLSDFAVVERGWLVFIVRGTPMTRDYCPGCAEGIMPLLPMRKAEASSEGQSERR